MCVCQKNNKRYDKRCTVLIAHIHTDSGIKFSLSLAIVSYGSAFDMLLDFSDWSKDYLMGKENVMRFEELLLPGLKEYFPR